MRSAAELSRAFRSEREGALIFGIALLSGNIPFTQGDHNFGQSYPY
jgi:hypothetical protein